MSEILSPFEKRIKVQGDAVSRAKTQIVHNIWEAVPPYALLAVASIVAAQQTGRAIDSFNYFSDEASAIRSAMPAYNAQLRASFVTNAFNEGLAKLGNTPDKEVSVELFKPVPRMDDEEDEGTQFTNLVRLLPFESDRATGNVLEQARADIANGIVSIDPIVKAGLHLPDLYTPLLTPTGTRIPVPVEIPGGYLRYTHEGKRGSRIVELVLSPI